MEDMQVLYRGIANIYLQGHNALCPIEETINNSHEIRYCIGDASTEFFIKDLRKELVLEANEAIRLSRQNGFTRDFNQQAWVEVRYEPSQEKVEIELRDPVKISQEKMPLLWLGVLENNLMPAYEVDWEIFKPLAGSTAFVSLVR